jgi:hypothetical protein
MKPSAGHPIPSKLKAVATDDLEATGARLDVTAVTIARFPDVLPRDRQGGHGKERGMGTQYRAGRSAHWLKIKNPDAPAVRRLEEEDWNG